MKLRGFLLFIFGVFSAAAAEASFGAIAYSPSSGRAGTAWGYFYQYDAMNAAVVNCNWYDCQAMVWVNNACGSLAVSQMNSYHYASAWSTNRYEAERLALQACGFNCYSKAWVCSF